VGGIRGGGVRGGRGADSAIQVSRCMHKCVFVQQRGGVETYRLDHELRQCRDMMDIGLGRGPKEGGYSGRGGWNLIRWGWGLEWHQGGWELGRHPKGGAIQGPMASVGAMCVACEMTHT
jgi:hypothetical protein